MPKIILLDSIRSMQNVGAIFRNAETDEVNVVYKRKGGDYGLIEPEF